MSVAEKTAEKTPETAADPYAIVEKPLTLRQLLKRFRSWMWGYKFRFSVAILGMLLSAAAQAESAHLIEPILNKIFTEKRTDLLYILPFGVFFLYLFKNLGLYLQSTQMGFIGIDIANRLRKQILARCIHMDLGFFKRHSSGELISRSLNDLGSLRVILAQHMPDLIRELFTAVGLLAVVIYQSWTLAIFAFIILPAALFPLRAFARRMRKIGLASQQNNARLTSVLAEIFANIELIKSSSAERFEQGKFAAQSDEQSRLAYRGIRIEALSSPTMETFGSLGVSAVLIIGGHEVIAGHMQVGNFFSFLTALFLLYQPVRRISGIYANMQMNLAASARTLAMLDLAPSIKGGEQICGQITRLEAKNLWLSYEAPCGQRAVTGKKSSSGEKCAQAPCGQRAVIGKKSSEEKLPVSGLLPPGGARQICALNPDSAALNPDSAALKGLNFCLESGKIYALIGRSGSGKSSLINALLRFYEPCCGELLADGAEIANFSLASYRAQIALVSQNIYLFAGSVAENVAYASEFCEEKIHAALQMAGASEFVAQLGGIGAQLAEGGGNLSGGQRQRLALARAFYKDASVVIFDEATSALDMATQQAVARSIAAASEGKITILIAHRLESLAIAHEALLLASGRLIARGSLAELENNEDFKRLKGELDD